jgi:hypothetical protein
MKAKIKFNTPKRSYKRDELNEDVFYYSYDYGGRIENSHIYARSGSSIIEINVEGYLHTYDIEGLAENMLFVPVPNETTIDIQLVQNLK